MKKYFTALFSIVLILCLTACSNTQNATNNNKLTGNTTSQITSNTANESNNNASSTNSSVANNSSSTNREGYDIDIEKDRKKFNSNKINIVVGDNLYATQINDWYANFSDYNGKTVEIEGYYINDEPYTFVGRFGPSCPYCSGGYVSFEFYTTENLSSFVSGKDWIKVKGILRKGKDSSGDFNYIEAISIEKGKVGKDTVTN